MTELIIFDSDGVLVDSEIIALTVLARTASEEGAAIGVDEAIRSYRGLKMADCVREIERRLGRSVRETFVADLRRATALAFDAELKPVVGIHAALAEITIPVCVASNGPMSKLTHTLSLTKLLGHFEGRIFSAYEVGSWKPDPGLSCMRRKCWAFTLHVASSSRTRCPGFTRQRPLGCASWVLPGAIRVLNWSWERSARTSSTG
jgi:beta-phosphoglucomutase-like phosphatase (HAD superfamily)